MPLRHCPRRWGQAVMLLGAPLSCGNSPCVACAARLRKRNSFYFVDNRPIATLSQRPKENILLPLAVRKRVLHGSSPFTKGSVPRRKLRSVP